MRDMIVKTVVCDLWGKCKNLLEVFLTKDVEFCSTRGRFGSTLQVFLGWMLRLWLDLRLVLLR